MGRYPSHPNPNPSSRKETVAMQHADFSVSDLGMCVVIFLCIAVGMRLLTCHRFGIHQTQELQVLL